MDDGLATERDLAAETIRSRLSIGGNSPPDPIEDLRARLTETYTDLSARADELLGMEARLPATMDDDWEAKITEAIKSCTKFSRNAEVTRLSANEPHRALIAATDGFFKAMSDKVDALKKKMAEKYLTPYQQAKKAEEQRRRDAAAAEAKRLADEEARKVREENARLAEIKRQEDEARQAAARREEEARQAAARAEAARVAAARQAAEAKNREERAAAAEAQRIADAEAAAAKKKADDEAAAAKREQDRLAAERIEQEAIQKKARDDAAQAKVDKDKASRFAGEKAADMSRTRTTLGAVASLRTTWEFEVTNPDLVPRQFLSVNEKAIRIAVRAATTEDGKNTLKIEGVRIYPETSSVVR